MKSVLAPNRPIPTLDPVNDGRHQLKDGPLERESVPYIIVLPDEGIAAFSYTWVNKDSKAGSAFVVFGPGVGEQPITEAVDGIEIPRTMNFDNWQVGAVHLRHDLKLQSAEFSLKGAQAAIEARFEAAHPAYAYAFHPDGCPDWAATNRTEQAGTVTGHIRVNGRTIPFATTGARDHSWGTRDWQAPQHWKWLHAQAGPELCVHFWEMHARGRTELRGYVFRDGRMAEVDSLEVDFDKDAQFRQTRIDAVVHDTAGRKTRVKGNFFAHYALIPGPHTTLNEGALRCEIDGKAGVGWSEFMWPTPYLEYLRGQKS